MQNKLIRALRKSIKMPINKLKSLYTRKSPKLIL